MQRNTVYILVMMVGLLAAGILGYVYYPRNYPVFSDVSKPEEFPEVSWQDIVQGRVDAFLLKLDIDLFVFLPLFASFKLDITK